MTARRIGTLAVFALTATAAQASSHREAPFITKLPQVDATDFYLFTSYEPDRADFVTMIANYVPLQESYGGPNYYPLDADAVYEIHVDNTGDAVEDLSFRFRFDDVLPEGGIVAFDIGGTPVSTVLRNVAPVSADDESGLSHRQTYQLDLVTGDRRDGTAEAVTDASSGEGTFRKPFDYAGHKTLGPPSDYLDYARSFVYEVNVPGCDAPGRVFVGQRYEPFKVALGEIFDLVNFVPIEGDSAPGAGDGGGFPGGVAQDVTRNALKRNNVTSLALEVHRDCLTSADGDVIGAWTTASLPQARLLNPEPTFDRPQVTGGALTQVSRLSAPLVNELVIGYDRKDAFNASEPANDAQFLTFVTNPVLPAILDALFREPVNTTLGTSFENLAPGNIPRDDLVAAFLTGFPGVNQFPEATPGEMLRLNTAIPPTPREDQSPLGLAAGDLAGFPNGRRPVDDVVDIALRVAMGALCYDLPVGDGGAPTNLGYCAPEDAPVGDVAFTDGVPTAPEMFNLGFPYLLTPYPGSPDRAPLPTSQFNR